jgi:hypothetical protein
MSGTWDANIISAYAVADGGSFALDAIADGDAFDVVANIRIGQNLMQFVDRCDLFVSVRDLSQSRTLLCQRQSYELTPRKAALNQTLRVRFDAGWNANEGDVLDVVAPSRSPPGSISITPWREASPSSSPVTSAAPALGSADDRTLACSSTGPLWSAMS